MNRPVWMYRISLAVIATSLAVSATIAQQNQTQVPRAAGRGSTPAAQQGNPQQPFQQQRVTANKAVAENNADRTSDSEIASCVAIGNQTEVAMAKMAESMSQNKDVRNFAATLVKDHSEFLRQLERFGAQERPLNENVARNDDGNRARAFSPNTQQQQTAASQNGQQHRGNLDHLAIQRQIAERCLAEARKDLEQKQGNHRDEAFVGMQLAGHQHMLAELEVLEQYASPELRSVLNQGRQTTEKHLETAKSLIHGLVAHDRDNKNNERNEK